MSVRLLGILLPWLGGLALGVGHISHVPVFIIAGLLGLAGVIFYWRIQVAIAAIIILLLGWVWGGVSATVGPLPSCPMPKEVKGTISEIVSRKENTMQFVVEGSAACRYLITASAETIYHRGDVVVVVGTPDKISTDEADAGYADYLRRKQISASYRFAQVTIVKPSLSILGRLRDHLRAQVNRTFLEPEASLTNAMLFNESGTLPQDVLDHFRITGVTHVLAISGSNITLLVGLLVVVLWPLKITPWWRSFILLAVLWLYIILIDKPVSAVRASYFWSIAIIAFRLSRLVGWPTIVLLTTTIMASLVPTVLSDISFQLSLGAVVGIGLTLFFIRGSSLGDIKFGLADVLFSTLGATLATWPLIAFWFGTVSLTSLPANLLVLPAFSLMYTLMVITLLISFVVPYVSLWITFIVHLLWLWVNWVTTFLAGVPYASFSNVYISKPMVLVYYVALAAALTVWLRIQKRSWLEIWQ